MYAPMRSTPLPLRARRKNAIERDDEGHRHEWLHILVRLAALRRADGGGRKRLAIFRLVVGRHVATGIGGPVLSDRAETGAGLGRPSAVRVGRQLARREGHGLAAADGALIDAVASMERNATAQIGQCESRPPIA